jgi:four helix bundle protein
MRIAEFGVRNGDKGKCGMWSAKCGMKPRLTLPCTRTYPGQIRRTSIFFLLTVRITMAAAQNPLRERTKKFGLRVIRLVDSLPTRRSARVIGDQLLRSGTSPGANYRSACRARSAAEFCSKLGIVEEELDESLYWMEMLVEAGLMPEKRLSLLRREGEELLAMTVASINTTRKRK